RDNGDGETHGCLTGSLEGADLVVDDEALIALRAEAGPELLAVPGQRELGLLPAQPDPRRGVAASDPPADEELVARGELHAKRHPPQKLRARAVGGVTELADQVEEQPVSERGLDAEGGV